MPDVPTSRTEMIRLLRAAMADHAASRPADAVSDEEVALLIEGSLDELPEADRQRILHAVASDPDLASVVADLNEAGLASARRGSYEGSPVLFRIARVGFALAACLALMLGVWRLADPPAIYRDGSGTLQPYQAPNGNDYWDTVDRQHLAERAERDRIRDYALLTSAGACVILAVPLAWWVLRSGPRRRGG